LDRKTVTLSKGKKKMQISVYGALNYDRSGKIRWLLEELKVPFQNRWLNVEKGERDEGAYLKVNPLGRIPAITLSDKPMIESNAICSYLADYYSERELAPELKSSERIAYQQWMYFAVSIDSFASRMSIIEDIPEGEVKIQKTESFFEEVKDLIGFLGSSLGKRDYLLEKFSAADVCVGYHLFFASLWPEMKKVIDANPQVSAYLGRLKARSAAVQSKVFSYEA
jgi:glutathione S-transferase